MLQRLAGAIAEMEGFYKPRSVPQRLNNPGDLMFAHQRKAVPHSIVGSDNKVRIYAEFPTIEDGWEALYRQIRLDASRGLTISQFIHKYAPADDGNNPRSYTAYVCRRLGVGKDSLLSSLLPDQAAISTT